MAADCEHAWAFVKDWEGDDTIPNGTRDASHWYCAECDTTTYNEPADYEEPFQEPYED